MTSTIRDTLKTKIGEKWRDMKPVLNERSRRLWAATEARSIGRGGVLIVATVTGLARDTLYDGLNELADTTHSAPEGRIRRVGGGRKTLIANDPTLVDDLMTHLAPTERGDPESPLRWTTKSCAHLAKALTPKHDASEDTVARILKQKQYSLQSNRKRSEGTNHPDRDAQFQYIHDTITQQQAHNQPCISIDTKKKENVGNYKNNGAEWHEKGKPIEVNMHDFPDKELGKAIPYGIYDINNNAGWVSVGVTNDTAVFAVRSITTWWKRMGKKRYPHATELTITADSGGSNSARSRLWKVELQKFANATGLTIHVRHFPPGTSKWNKIEHRLFSMITKNWRGRPLDSYATIVNLIGNTTTTTGLTVKAVLDTNTYKTGIVVSDDELANVNLTRDEFHGEWNYTVAPQSIPVNVR